MNHVVIQTTRDICIIVVIVAVVLLNIFGWAKAIINQSRMKRPKRKP